MYKSSTDEGDNLLLSLGQLWLTAKDRYLLASDQKDSKPLEYDPPQLNRPRLPGEYRATTNTGRAYETALRQFFVGFSDLYSLYRPVRPWLVTPAVVNDWKLAMTTLGRDAKSINQKLAALYGYYKYVIGLFDIPNTAEWQPLLERGLLYLSPKTNNNDYLTLWDKPNPVSPDYVERPKGRQKRAKFPAPEKLGQILANIDTTSLIGLRDYALMKSIAVTGCRNSEIRHLKWADIEPAKNGNYIISYTYKGGGEHQSELSAGAYQDIVTYLKAAGRWPCPPQHYIFIDMVEAGNGQYSANPNKAISYPTVLRHYNKYIAAAGQEKKGGLHGLRHAAAHQMIEKGATIKQVQKTLGHKSSGTTDRYVEVNHTQPQNPYLDDLETTFSK